MRAGKEPRANGKSRFNVAAEVMASDFAGIVIEAVDATMWPIYPPGWLQPEAPASTPSWSGLTIERRHRLPAPDFLQCPLAPFDRSFGQASGPSPAATSSAAVPGIPASGLDPLGWDPRAFSPTKEVK